MNPRMKRRIASKNPSRGYAAGLSDPPAPVVSSRPATPPRVSSETAALSSETAALSSEAAALSSEAAALSSEAAALSSETAALSPEAAALSPETAALALVRRVHALAAAALMLVYLAFMSGHPASIDGLSMVRQAHALVFDHSVRFQTPLWDWTADPRWASKYGIGLSLVYIPGLMLASPIVSQMPTAPQRPANLAKYYLSQIYSDPFYTVGASWVHAVIVAAAAFLVARLATALGCSRRASLWSMAFYGIGSAAFVYSRGDFAQPLEGLCWTAALLGAMRFRESGALSMLGCCAAAAGYAILTRPVEGALLLPAALLLVLPADPRQWKARALAPAVAIGVSAVAAVVLTLMINWARFGDAATSGYRENGVWSFPGVATLSALFVSPGRGILWEFPALFLVPLGAAVLVRRGMRREVVAILALSGLLLAMTSIWHAWWGGWCWGLRLFLPATPLLAAVAGAAVDHLGASSRRWIPGFLLFAGFAWALPGAVTDILGGYGQSIDGADRIWALATYPPYGAWGFLTHVFAESPTDPNAVDVLWFRLAAATGNWSLLAPLLLLASAFGLVLAARHSLLAADRLAPDRAGRDSLDDGRNLAPFNVAR